MVCLKVFTPTPRAVDLNDLKRERGMIITIKSVRKNKLSNVLSCGDLEVSTRTKIKSSNTSRRSNGDNLTEEIVDLRATISTLA